MLILDKEIFQNRSVPIFLFGTDGILGRPLLCQMLMKISKDTFVDNNSEY